MTTVYRYISSKAVIGKALMNFGITDSNLHSNALEWIGEGISEIGYHVGFINKWAAVSIQNHTLEYPEGFFRLNFVVYKGRKLLNGYRPNTAHYKKSGGENPETSLELFKLLDAKKNVIDYQYNKISEDDLYSCRSKDCNEIIDKDELDRLNKKIRILTKEVLGTSFGSCEEYYVITEGCIKTSVREGKAYVHYKAFPIDDYGYPLVLDEFKYKRALEYVIMERLMRSGYTHPVLSYDRVAQDMKIYISKASNEHSKMTYERAQDFASNWTNMLFSLNPVDTFSNG